MRFVLLPAALLAVRHVPPMAVQVWATVRAAEVADDAKVHAAEIARRCATSTVHVLFCYRKLVEAGLLETWKDCGRLFARTRWPEWLGDEDCFRRAERAAVDAEKRRAA